MLDFKHHIAGQPYRLARRVTEGDFHEADNDPEMLIMLMGAAYTAAANLAAPFALIQAGVRGERYFTGLATGYSKLGYPMPLFNYSTPWSRAERIGSKVGSTVGSVLVPGRRPVTWTGAFGKTTTLAKGAASGARVGGKIGARVGGRLIPGVGWALLAYDVYDIAANRSLWGFDLS